MEQWKEVKEAGSKYLVSSYGRVKSLHRVGRMGEKGRILTPKTRHGGYKFIRLCNDGRWKDYSIHRLVAKMFIPNPDNKPEINHIDSNVSNNVVDNLEWFTARENTIYAHTKGSARKNKTGFVGVYRTGGKYQAQIYKNGKKICLGSYKTAEEASMVYGLYL